MRIAVLLVLPAALVISAACTDSGGQCTSATWCGDDGGGPGNDGSSMADVTFPDAQSGGFDIQPEAQQTLNVTIGSATPPTVAYSAFSGTAPISVGWEVDRGEIATVDLGPATKTTLTPTATTGGIVTITGKANSDEASRTTFVKLSGTQNGPSTDPSEQSEVVTSTSQLGTGGGVGGVGGEGLGPAVSDPATLQALESPTQDGSAQGLKFLYPYDGTVWPRGMLAPLLMWSWSFNDADAIQITLTTTSKSFSWTGTFARPTILQQTGGTFVHHPVPQDIWAMATNTAGTIINNVRDDLTVSVVVAKNHVGYGPITETYKVAPGRLTGTVYYNSYGTRLVHNAGTDSVGNPVGAAILSIRSGDTAPKVAAGTDSTDNQGCRTCHTVASHGKWLVAQDPDQTTGVEDDYDSHLYDLSQTSPPDQPIAPKAKFAWSALSSDGSLAFTNTTHPSCINVGVSNSQSELWQMSATPSLTTFTGLPQGLAAGYPAFAPDDKLLAYVDTTGHVGTAEGPLMVAAFDLTSHAFSNVRQLASAASGQLVGFPSFLPDDSALLYQTQVRGSPGGPEGVFCSDVNNIVTRVGARGEIWWVNASGGAPQPVALASLNGKSNGQPYLPMGPNNHGASTATDPNDPYSESGWDDTTLNYEPNVLPVAAGGYAWVVFTSRRMYGNELQAVPYNSWPGAYDSSDIALGTVKKLWVAAIDLSAPPGSDPSHPAFYLPAQELLAGNSRAFWAFDPCKGDGSSCTSGDQCCNGTCAPDAQNQLVCTTGSGCSSEGNACTSASDCCDSTDQCIDGFCTIVEPN